MKKANNIKNVEVRENGSIKVTYMNGLTRTYKKMTKAAEMWLKGNNATETKTEETAWVFEYLKKKGKSLDTLEKAIMRMSKAEIIEKFRHLGLGLTMGHNKTEMLSGILMKLQELGYKQEDQEAPKKAKKKKPVDKETVKKGLEYASILESDMSDEEVLKALGFESWMNVMTWWEPIAGAVSTATKECGLDMTAGMRLDDLYAVAVAMAA